MRKKGKRTGRILLSLIVILILAASVCACAKAENKNAAAREENIISGSANRTEADANSGSGNRTDAVAKSGSGGSPEIEIDPEFSFSPGDDQLNKTAGPLPGPDEAGQLRVEDLYLLAADGSRIQLKGISTHGLSWFPDYVNQDLFNEIRNWGANVVRLAMYTAE
ncbi:MAG: cellulase family glycosylhydrolase, partial [Eubacterium sp.]|nr:cellulase family glycosylhydrolase [Eubacterium sp.]